MSVAPLSVVSTLGSRRLWLHPGGIRAIYTHFGEMPPTPPPDSCARLSTSHDRFPQGKRKRPHGYRTMRPYLWCPRPESNRHDREVEGFSYHFGFCRQRMRCSWSGARLHHSLAALGARRLLSTPSQALDLGLARRWLGCWNIQGFRRL